MTAALDDVAARKKGRPEPTAEQKLAEELVARAREQGVSLTGPDGLLKQLTKVVLETALNQEMTEHLGHEKGGQPAAGNVRNGTRPKTVLTEATGQVPIEVPRDRDSTFEPQIVRRRQRRLSGVDEMVLSLYAKGLTTGEISAHFAEIYGAQVSQETISRITGKVLGEMAGWCGRPLDQVYAAIFIDAVMVKVGDGQVDGRPVCEYGSSNSLRPPLADVSAISESRCAGGRPRRRPPPPTRTARRRRRAPSPSRRWP